MPQTILLFLVALIASCASVENETDIALSEVPAPVMAAASRAVPGIEIIEAEIEEEDGQTIYELSGEVDGKEYEIEISAAGEVLEVEED